MDLSISGGANSFQELVRRYSGDMPYRAVLDELNTDGSIERLDDNRVKLIHRAYLPKADESMKVHIFGVDTAFLIDTIDHNLNVKNCPPRFQRKVLTITCLTRRFRNSGAFPLERHRSCWRNWMCGFHAMTETSNPKVEGAGSNTAGVGIYYFEEKHG